MKNYDEVINEFKRTLSIEQVMDLVADLGGEPQLKNEYFVSKTICHNHRGEGSHKLYYYENTNLFRCYTDCDNPVFDIFDLITRVKRLEGIENWSVVDSVNFAARYFNYELDCQQDKELSFRSEDWAFFDKIESLKDIKLQTQTIEYKVYDAEILKRLPHPRILPWEAEGITPEVIEKFEIAYDPVNQSIIIPHYNMMGDLIGIRERVLVKEAEKKGKYKPAILNRQMYNHPLGFNLYNLNHSKNNIEALKKAIVWESEKSCLLYSSYFGYENDITVACCGSSLTNFQIDLLCSLGVEEIIIGFDKQFQKIGDPEWERWTKKLTDFHTKYGNKVQLSFLFDTTDLLAYKASPIDQGPELFLQMFNERVYL